MKCAIVTNDSNKKVVQHALPRFILAFGVSDDRDVDIVTRFNLVPAGSVVTNNDAFGSVTDNPFGKSFEDGVGLVRDPKF